MKKALAAVDVLIKRIATFEASLKACPQERLTRGYLNGRIKGLEELWRDLVEANQKVELLKTNDNGEETYFKDDVFQDLEKRCFQLRGEMEDYLETLEHKQQGNRKENENRNNQDNQNGRQQIEQSKVKLPKISLPIFDGSYHSWLSFKNRFTHLIHSSKSLNDAEKLEYLQSCVTGTAERTIKRFQITDQNYKVAWDRLNDKYDNKRILQDTQVEMIIDRREIKIETSKELRELLDVIQESLEALKNMQVDTTSWDPMLVVLVKRKLPFKTREEWEKELKPEDVPTYEQLIAFLEKRFRTVESLELVGSTATQGECKYTFNKLKSNQSSSHRKICQACNKESHSLMICESFLNMTVCNRAAFVNAKRFCRNCLAIGHILNECHSTRRCYKCNLNHHTLLHEDEDPAYSSRAFFTYPNSNWNNNPDRNPSFNPQYNPNYHPMFNPQHNPNSDLDLKSNNHPNGINRSSTSNQRTVQTQQHQNVQPVQYSQPIQSAINQENSQPKRNLTAITDSQQINGKMEAETLFPTAIIKVKSAGGTIYHLRALLDQ